MVIMQLTKQFFTKVLDKLRQYSWRSTFEGTRRLKWVLLRLSLVSSGHLSVEFGLAAAAFARRAYHIKRKSGLLFLALYLKQCGVALQQMYGCTSVNRLTTTSSSVSVSLSRSGIPRITPRYHRHKILRRDARVDMLVKMYLSWFGMSRLIMLAKPISKGFFKSILTPCTNMDGVDKVVSIFKQKLNKLEKTYLPWIRTIPLNLGMKWVTTWKSLPNSLRQVGGDSSNDSIFTLIFLELSSFGGLQLAEQELAPPAKGIGTVSILKLWRSVTLFAGDHDYTNRTVVQDDLEFQALQGYSQNLWTEVFHRFGHQTYGRFSQVLAGAGKRRLFAIGNYFKQRLLFPFHEWAMKVLSLLPTDGTYDQSKPIDRLIKLNKREVYSFDLSSATDRFPTLVLFAVIKALFGWGLATTVVSCGLVTNIFTVKPPMVKKVNRMAFVCGQPLGYYGSWALFSLAHHMMVWLAADAAYPSRASPFRDYAILGDDVVIADKRVAQEYLTLMELLGVSISEPKSLRSDIGALEFAKQYSVGKRNLSPISSRALHVLRSPLGLATLAGMYDISERVYLRLAGAGFRVRARMGGTMSRKWLRFRVVYDKSKGSDQFDLEWWIGRGLPLDPYLKGVMIEYLKDRLKPRQLTFVPDDMMDEHDATFNEYTLYRNWVSQWLEWLKDYCVLCSKPCPTVQEFLQLPVVETSWRRRNMDIT